MSMKNKLKNFFSMEDEEYEYEYIETERDSHEEQEQKKSRPMLLINLRANRM